MYRINNRDRVILDTFNPIVKNAYLEYKNSSEECDYMEMLNENIGDRKYYVYEWFTKNENKIFYVGKGTGKRYAHIISDMKRNRGGYYKQLEDKYGISYRILLENLTEQEALIYEIYIIWKREKEGEVLIQSIDSDSRLENYDIERTKVDNNVKPNILISPIIKRYFPEKIIDNPKYDKVKFDCLMKAYLRLNHTEDAKKITKFIKQNGGIVFNSKAKSAKCFIEFIVTDYSKYLEYKKFNYQIYHFLDVLDFIEKHKS